MTFGGPGRSKGFTGKEPGRPASTAKSGGWSKPMAAGGHAPIGNKAHVGKLGGAADSAGHTARPTSIAAGHQTPPPVVRQTIGNIKGTGEGKERQAGAAYAGSKGSVPQAFARPRNGKV